MTLHKKLRASKLDGGDCAASGLWCQEKRLLDIVVRLWKVAASNPGPLTGERGPIEPRELIGREIDCTPAAY
jgi:hypothetical protein